MAIGVVMPKLGLTMTEGLLVAWLVSDGDSVKQGQALFEIETDKATMEAEATADGVIKILVEAGETVNVNARVGLILAPDEAAPDTDNDIAQTKTSPSAVLAAVTPATPSIRRDRKRASPAAKRVARELGIDIQMVEGSGEAGRVEVADVHRFAREETIPEAADDDEEQMSPDNEDDKSMEEMPTTPAQHVTPITLTSDADATSLVAMVETLNRRYADQLGFDITFNEVLVLITARVMREFASLNAYFEDGELRHSDDINIKVALEVNGALTTPVIRQADTKSVVQIGQELHDPSSPTREDIDHAHKSPPGSFIITNLGVYNIDTFTPIIEPPAVACLGAGRIVERQANHDQQVSPCPMLTLSLTVNSRVVDNWEAARFLNRLCTLIETPYLLAAI